VPILDFLRGGKAIDSQLLYSNWKRVRGGRKVFTKRKKGTTFKAGTSKRIGFHNQPSMPSRGGVLPFVPQ